MVGPINGCSVLGGPPCGLAGLSRGCFSFRFAGHEPQQAETTLCTKSKGWSLLLLVVVGCWLLAVKGLACTKSAVLCTCAVIFVVLGFH